MAFVKRIMRREVPRAVACWSIARYLWLLGVTGRWTVDGADIPAALLGAGRPFILGFWHGRLMMMPEAWRFAAPFHMLTSRHPDGRLIARTLGHLGIDTVAGSTDRGGAEVLRAMVRLLKQGECIGVTPDGPRGPRMRASVGIVQIARLAGVPIVPATCAARPRRLIPSWDRLVVPLPFGRRIVAWGEPIEIERDADDEAVEAARVRLERRLNEMTRALDVRLGLDPVEPAPEAPGGAV